MKYFIDTEFLEGTQKTMFGKTKPTIDLISIGIISEDNREYYAISKNFNLKEAWNRYQIKIVYGDARNHYPKGIKVYWLRDNVLKPIFVELCKKSWTFDLSELTFSYENLKKVISYFGKTNKQIVEEVKEFCILKNQLDKSTISNSNDIDYPQFYGYYCDYDWVVFCWLFGKMIDLPAGFPMYCIDLRQTMDEVANIKYAHLRDDIDSRKGIVGEEYSLKRKLDVMKNSNSFPKQTNEHNALADARWNKQLYEFLNTI